MFKRILALVGLSLSLGQTAVVAEHQEETIDIGSRLELFVDDFLVEEMSGVELLLHSPQSAGKVLNFDKPWEGNTGFYVNSLKDDDRYRMYYRGSNYPDYVQASLLEPGEKVGVHHPFTISYAESKDGIHWERPDLGIYEFEGSRANSIV